MRINNAPLAIHEVMEPENSYMRFTTYGYALDKYMTPTLNDRIYHSRILELNRQALLWQAKLARKFGFRCWIRCVEMTTIGPRTSPRYFLAASR